MKTLKILFKTLLAIVLLVVVVLVVLLSSAGLQTSLAQRFLPPGMAVQSAHMGFNGLQMQGVEIDDPAFHLRIESVQGDFPLLRTLARREARLSELTVAGVVLRLKETEPDVRPPTDPTDRPDQPVRPDRPVPDPSVAPDAPILPWDDLAAFEGLFAEPMSWPPLAIKRLSVEALILLPDDRQQVTLQLSGADIDGSASTEIDLVATYTDAGEDAVVTQATLRQTLRLALSDDGTITGLSLDLHAEAESPAAETRERYALAAQLDAQRLPDASGEVFGLSFTFDPDQPDAAEWVTVQAVYHYAQQSIEGAWSIDFDTRRVADLVDPLLNGAWASVQARGAFALDALAERFALEGTLNARAADLDRWQDTFTAAPDFLLETNFDLAGQGQRMEIRALRVHVAAPADTPLLAMEAEQVFGIDLASLEPFYGDPDQPLLRLALAGAPVDLINALVPDLQLALSAFTGEMVLAGSGEDLRLDTTQPLTIADLSVELAGEPMLSDLTIVLSPSIRMQPDLLTLDPGPVTLSRGAQELLELTAQVAVRNLQAEPDIALTASWTADLAGLLEQPAAEPFRNLSRGHWQGTLKAEGPVALIRADLDTAFSELVLADDGRRIDRLALQMTAQVDEAASQFRVAGPLTVEAENQTSLFDIALDLWPGDELVRVAFKGRGETVVVDHFLWLADAFQNPGYTPPTADEPSPETPVELVEHSPDAPSPGRPSATDTAAEPPAPQALWAGLQAEVDVEIDTLVLPGHAPLSALAVRARVTEEEAQLESFQAVLAGSPARAAGTLRFHPDADAEQRYRLAADLDLQGFDVGAYLRELEPDTEPMLDAILSVTGKATAVAGDPAELAEALVGQFSVQASDGVLRALRRGAVGRAAEAAGVAGQLGALLTGRQDVQTVSDLIAYFNAVRFETLAFEARRNPDYTIDLTRLTLRSPELRLEGQGRIDHVEGREFHQQPIALTLAMSARPPLARLLDELQLLEEEPDEDGYRAFNRPLEITGNVGEPDPRPLWVTILEAGARAGTRRLLGDSEDGEEKTPADRIRELPLDRLPRLPRL